MIGSNWANLRNKIAQVRFDLQSDQSIHVISAIPAPREINVDDPLEIPQALRLSAEQRRDAWAKNPPKAAPARVASPKKTEKPKRPDKTETLLAMLKDGATVDQLCSALEWLPHTLRARLSAISKPKKVGGLGIKIERTRADGVTSYRSL